MNKHSDGSSNSDWGLCDIRALGINTSKGVTNSSNCYCGFHVIGNCGNVFKNSYLFAEFTIGECHGYSACFGSSDSDGRCNWFRERGSEA